MQTLIICPNCNTQFEPTAAIAQSVKDDLKKEYNQRWAELEKKKEEDFNKTLQQRDQLMRQKEQQWQQQQAEMLKREEEERKKLMSGLEKQLQERIKNDFENQLKLLEEANNTHKNKLTEAREKEMEFLKKLQEMETREQEMELQIQRKLMEERSKLTEVIKKEEEERIKLKDADHALRMEELRKQLDDQKRLIEEMKRKSEQGSMQLQGEVQELALEELLRSSFPFDVVKEVGKGVQGADCILIVRNSFGQECGKIIFESKRTKLFSEDWIEKLKTDARGQVADCAVLVTQAMPKVMEQFGEYKGVWICSFNDVRPLVYILRELLIKVQKAEKSQENRGDKMTMLYNYLVSAEFGEQWKAISEGFSFMRQSINKEREQMEKLWKAREKQLEKVILNAIHIKGSIEGIAGQDITMNLLTEGNGLLE